MNISAKTLKHQLIPLQPTHSTAPLDRSSNRLETCRNSRIILSFGEKLLFARIKDIVRLEADGNYTNVYLTENRKYVVSKTLKYFMLQLPATHFARIHQSHAINLFHVEYIESMKYAAMSDNSRLNISRRNRLELKSKLKEMMLQ